VAARDRRFLAGLSLLAATGTAAGLLAFGHGGGGAAAAGCLRYDQPGVLGGGTWHLCGADAAAFCRAHRAESAKLAAKCEGLAR
jgi:hypothetical protein